MTVAGFCHGDHERTIAFGSGVISRATELLPERFILMATTRALQGAGEIAEIATDTLLVPAGQVNDLASRMLKRGTPSRPIAALGGGRVIDTAKAVAAAAGGLSVTAIPTSLSGAEMTGIHRHARGVPDETPRVRPSVVINDPALSASQPVAQLAASTANALAHAVAAVTGIRSTPISRAVALDGIRRLAAGWSGDEPDRDSLALGALLAGWGLDQSGVGPHHALAQTAVREASLAHAEVNAALLPFTLPAIRIRSEARVGEIDAALGRPVEEVAELLRLRSGASALDAVVDDPARLRRTVGTAVRRPELRNATPPFTPDEITAIYRAARTSLRPSP